MAKHYLRLSESLAKVEAQIEAAAFPGLRVVAIKENDHGFGVVLVRRDVDDYITWIWATIDTSGEPIATPTGATLYSGNYDMTRDEGTLDFEARNA